MNENKYITEKTDEYNKNKQQNTYEREKHR